MRGSNAGSTRDGLLRHMSRLSARECGAALRLRADSESGQVGSVVFLIFQSRSCEVRSRLPPLTYSIVNSNMQMKPGFISYIIPWLARREHIAY